MSEIGPAGIKKFNSAKQFVSWFRLSPSNKVSGGKTRSSKIARGSNRLKIALRQAANLSAGRCNRKYEKNESLFLLYTNMHQKRKSIYSNSYSQKAGYDYLEYGY